MLNLLYSALPTGQDVDHDKEWRSGSELAVVVVCVDITTARVATCSGTSSRLELVLICDGWPGRASSSQGEACFGEIIPGAHEESDLALSRGDARSPTSEAVLCIKSGASVYLLVFWPRELLGEAACMVSHFALRLKRPQSPAAELRSGDSSFFGLWQETEGSTDEAEMRLQLSKPPDELLFFDGRAHLDVVGDGTSCSGLVDAS